jgi:hypothetical protein
MHSCVVPCCVMLCCDVQIENEYGYYGHDKVYLRHLISLVRQHMGQGVLLYTVDGASLLPVVRGTLPGGEVLTTVDFGPTTDVEAAFALQRRWAGGWRGAATGCLGVGGGGGEGVGDGQAHCPLGAGRQGKSGQSTHL